VIVPTLNDCFLSHVQSTHQPSRAIISKTTLLMCSVLKFFSMTSVSLLTFPSLLACSLLQPRSFLAYGT
jgi:hypothetical protein